MRVLCASLLLAGALMGASLPDTKQVRGNYIEARTADVYTGPCFANGEVENMGDLAVFGWNIEKGAFQGVSLEGLSVVAAVKAKSTLGNRFGASYPVRSVLILDQKATPEQQLALQSFARRMAGDLLQDIVRVERAPIDFKLDGASVHDSAATMTAGTLAAIRTRAMSDGDHICRNEEIWYDPLTKVDHAMPAVTVRHDFKGQGLGSTWSSPNKRSAFLATFSYSE